MMPTGLSPCAAAPSRAFGYRYGFLLRGACCRAPIGRSQPHRYIGQQTTKHRRFGLFPVRSPLLGESRLIFFPRGTKMFQFPRFPSRSRRIPRHYPRRVAPFGYLRINARLTAPRSLSRTSRALLRPLAPRRPPHALINWHVPHISLRIRSTFYSAPLTHQGMFRRNQSHPVQFLTY